MLANKLVRFVPFAWILALPGIAAAQEGNITNLSSLLSFISNVINAIIPILIGLAVLFFIWGLLKYVTAAGDPEARDSARNIMIWGVIIIFVMVSIWALVNFLSNTFFGGGTGTVQAPPAVTTPGGL